MQIINLFVSCSFGFAGLAPIGYGFRIPFQSDEDLLRIRT